MNTLKKLCIALVVIAVIMIPVYLLLLRPKAVEIHLNSIPFAELPGWGHSNLKPSFDTFKASCRVFLKMAPDKSVGSDFITLKASDWVPTCQAAMALTSSADAVQLQQFFQTWFVAVEFHNGKPVEGLFTGYYMSSLKGSLVKTKRFNVPIYGVPDNLVTVHLSDFDPSFKNRKLVGRIVRHHRLMPYYTRAEIDRGAIVGKAPVIAWVDSKIDRLFLEIQGSGVIQLTDGSMLYIGYAAQNGAPYTAIASVLIKQGVMTKDSASMQKIREYLQSHPKQIKPVLNQNKSFVFFETSKKPDAFGSQGIELTPGYSMAVDVEWVPMGTPIWLNTSRPDEKNTSKSYPFKRLMIAQDTGGAIRGPVRGDIYWGVGDRATSIAGRMKHPGQYWMLLPKSVYAQVLSKG